MRIGVIAKQLIGSLLCAAALTGSAAAQSGLTRAQVYARAAAMTALGRKLFADPSLSASGRLACATCHDPRYSFGPSTSLAVQLGGKDMRQPGFRAVQSLKYLQAVPQFTEHYHDSDDEGDASIDNGPTGGLTWDGRVDRGRDQARLPLLSPVEMANSSEAEVVDKVARADYAGEIKALFGNRIFDNSSAAFAAIVEALEIYEQSAPEFYPYSSKYDAYLAGRAELSPQEARGLALFNDPNRGNCGNCHRSTTGYNGTLPQFTDYGLIALGVPRNRTLAANADAAFYDLGACGPFRTDLAGHAEYCGRFRTPTLRNVALRQTFFHNGVVHTLREAIEFYVERDNKPEKWYPVVDGRVLKYDDLPAQYQRNINVEPPFGGQPGDPPIWSAAEIDDVIAFLKTLTDGYVPQGASGTNE